MANIVDFKYAPMFQTGNDDTQYRLLSTEGVSTASFEGHEIVKVSKEALTLLAPCVRFMTETQGFITGEYLRLQSPI